MQTETIPIGSKDGKKEESYLNIMDGGDDIENPYEEEN